MKDVINIIGTFASTYVKLAIIGIIAFFLFFGIMSWIGSMME